MRRLGGMRRVGLWIAIDWLAIAFLLVRIATGANFSVDGLAYTNATAPEQLALLGTAVVPSLYLAWRMPRNPTTSAATWSEVWAVAMVIVGGVLWWLGHQSAPAIIGLAVVAGVLSHEARSRHSP